MEDLAIQDYYEDKYSHCYGCGRLNEHGYYIKSRWDGQEAVCTFTPEPYHLAIPGFVYGGLIASLMDCHSIGAATAAAYQAEDRHMSTTPPYRYVTASLHVEYLRPTPAGETLLLRATVPEIAGRRAGVKCSLYAAGEECARGEVVAVRITDEWLRRFAGR